VNEVDLPRFRGTFHWVEVAIDHNYDEVCYQERSVSVIIR
jgi:hypothetical protein